MPASLAYCGGLSSKSDLPSFRPMIESVTTSVQGTYEAGPDISEPAAGSLLPVHIIPHPGRSTTVSQRYPCGSGGFPSASPARCKLAGPKVLDLQAYFPCKDHGPGFRLSSFSTDSGARDSRILSSTILI